MQDKITSKRYRMVQNTTKQFIKELFQLSVRKKLTVGNKEHKKLRQGKKEAVKYQAILRLTTCKL